jgi:hypothetical protein
MSYYSCSGNGMSYTNPLIMKGHFKSLSQINTAPVLIVLSIDTPLHMEPSFVSGKCKFWSKNTIMYCLQKSVTKLLSSLVITYFICLNLCCFTWPQHSILPSV